MRISRRIAAIMTAIAGGFDETLDYLETIKGLQNKVGSLQVAAENIQKDRDNWFAMWQKDGLGHANAQEMMAQEIDALIQMLTQTIEALEQKGVEVSAWRQRLRGYANSSSFLEAVHKNRENFLKIADQQSAKA